MKHKEDYPIKILFIVHEMNLTGAPFVVLELMKWLNTNQKNIIFDILTLNANGILYPEFVNVARKILQFPNENIRLRKKIRNAIIGEKKSPIQIFGNQLQAENYSHIYLNSVVALNGFMRLFQYFTNSKKILHVHETEFLTEVFFKNTNLEDFLTKIDYFIAVSEHSKINLIETYGIKEKKIEVIYPYVNENFPEKDIELRKKLGIDENDFVLGNIGTPQNVKGTDLIPIIVKKLKIKYPELKFKFLNIGGSDKNEALIIAKLDAKKLEIEKNILFLPHTNDVNQYIQLIDVYVLTSREESFSLMTAKATLCEIPIIMFSNNGGPSEIISSPNAYEVDYLDLDQMVETIYLTNKNYNEAKEKSKNGKKKILKHFSQVNSHEQIYQLIVEHIQK